MAGVIELLVYGYRLNLESETNFSHLNFLHFLLVHAAATRKCALSNGDMHPGFVIYYS